MHSAFTLKPKMVFYGYEKYPEPSNTHPNWRLKP